jgi:hypothetical protein
MNCAARPALLLEQKTPAEADWRGVQFGADLVNWIGRRKAIPLTERGRFASVAGFEYECTVAGETGKKEPILPTTIAATVMDGSVQLTCRAVSSGSLVATISSVVWTAPAAITVSDEEIQDTMAIARLAGGVAGEDYSISVAATLSDGRVLEEICVLPVRTPTADCQC